MHNLGIIIIYIVIIIFIYTAQSYADSQTHLGHKHIPPKAPSAHSLLSLTSSPISQ